MTRTLLRVRATGERFVDLMINTEFGIPKKPFRVSEDQRDAIFGDLQ